MAEINEVDIAIAQEKAVDCSGHVEPVVSLPFSLACYDCEHVTKFGFNDAHTTCDIINGQYTESDAINCEKCGLENLV